MRHFRSGPTFPRRKDLYSLCQSCDALILTTGELTKVCQGVEQCEFISNPTRFRVFVITLPNGDYTIVDYTDKPLVDAYSWRVNRYGHVRTDIGGKEVYLARLLIGRPRTIVDHISGDKLDNRRCNLRLATAAENSWNRAKKPGASSDYIGVVFNKARKQYQARITSKMAKIKFLGWFDDEHDAAEAYNKAAKELYGEFANLNDIQRPYKTLTHERVDVNKELLLEDQTT